MFNLIKEAKFGNVCSRERKLQKGRDKGLIFKPHNATQLFSIPNNPLLTFLTFSLMDTGHLNWMGSLCKRGPKQRLCSVQRPVEVSRGRGVPHGRRRPCPFHFPCPVALRANPSAALPLDNSIIKTKLGAIKRRLRCNSESGALVCAPSRSYLIHL